MELRGAGCCHFCRSHVSGLTLSDDVKLVAVLNSFQGMSVSKLDVYQQFMSGTLPHAFKSTGVLIGFLSPAVCVLYSPWYHFLVFNSKTCFLQGTESEQLAAASRDEDDVNFYQTVEPNVAKLFHIDPQDRRPVLALLKDDAEKISYFGELTSHCSCFAQNNLCLALRTLLLT